MEKLDNSSLMVGDWVSCDGKNYQIAEIGGMVCLDAEKEIFASLEDITPIPITPEILEKNGFNEQGKGENYTDYVFVPAIEGAPAPILVGFYKKPIKGVSILFKCTRSVCNGGGINDLHLCTLNYVHELQHALKLCGIDKEIKL